MQIWPAIDLRDGKCVRLQQGDYDRETIFGDDPLEIAQQWVGHGGDCLHLVDLDGARDGRLINQSAIESIVRGVDVPCELGGGVRSEEAIQRLLDLGLDRLVVGTQAIKQPDWFSQMIDKYPNKLVLGIDARNGQVATDGWLDTSEVDAVELAKQYEGRPLAAIVYTDIAKDGMMQGPNVDAMREMKESVSLPVVASGGVTKLEDVVHLAETRMDGCIIGRSLYEGQIDLGEAIAAAKL